jgi:hypothetical protein
MSIWASEDVAGEDEHGKLDGSVVSYIEGWSNHYPGHFPPPEDKRRNALNDLNEETPAAIGTAWLPAWCVPSDRERDLEWETNHDVDTHLGPWLRLDVTMSTVSIWAGVEIGKRDMHSICLNEVAVRALRDNLNEWLQREKVYPEAGDRNA